MEIGTLIKKFRTEKKLTQKQLGELCIPPIAESTIRRYELGKLNPKLETAQKIAEALGVPFYNFYADTLDFSSPDFYIESNNSSAANDQHKRLMLYFSMLNELGLSKMEQQLQELIKDQQYLK